MRAAVLRDSGAPPDWAVRPWAFVPEVCVAKVRGAFDGVAGGGGAGKGFPEPRISALESALPWRGGQAGSGLPPAAPRQA